MADLNNSSVVLDTQPPFALLFIQTAQGILLSVTNILLFSTIIYHEDLRLRKEYVIICGVALADGLLGIGTLLMPIVDQLELNSTVHGIVAQLVAFAMTAQALVLVMQSVDRLLAISVPFKYYSFTSTYAWRMVSAVFMYTAAQTAPFVYSQKSIAPGLPPIPRYVLSDAMFAFWHSTHMFYGCLSVVLYGIVMCKYERHLKKVVPAGATKAHQEAHMKRQRKITISMGISCVFTMLLFVLPRGVNMVLIVLKGGGEENAADKAKKAVIFMSYNINSMLNLGIYVKRHKEVREGVKCLFQLKQLPPLENIG